MMWRIGCVIIASLVIYLFWRDTVITTALLAVLAVIINLKSTKIEVTFFLSVSVIAAVVESITMSSGAWKYTNQHILNFPIWLPLYWGMGGVAMKDLYLLMTKMTK